MEEKEDIKSVVKEGFEFNSKLRSRLEAAVAEAEMARSQLVAMQSELCNTRGTLNQFNSAKVHTHTFS
jgi:chromosome condensin MukBEF ATPase and DNA-binding subunit MukB